MLGGWVNPHREQQTIPQGQTSIPPKYFSTPTANGQCAPRSGSARGVSRGASNTFHTHSGIDEKRPTEKFVFFRFTSCFMQLEEGDAPNGKDMEVWLAAITMELQGSIEEHLTGVFQ